MKAIYSVSGETIIIVGGNSGIGLSLITTLLECGAKVISIDIQKTTQLKKPRIKYYQADPKEKDQLERLMDRIQNDSIDITGLVNLSGTIAYFGSIEAATTNDWNETFNISFQSCLNSCQIFIPILRKAKKATIVNMSSGLAFIGQKNYGPYSAAKAAVVNLTKTLATELGPDIRVNCIAPGAVDTPFIYEKDGETRFDLSNYESRVPLGRIAQPSEIADVIMYLLSENASHINGECIHVNGGVG